jgi:hypothetical protein
MYFLYVANCRKKLLLIIGIILFWAVLIMGVGILFDDTIKYTVTVNSQISFTCPSDFAITDIYASDINSAPYIQASNSKYKSFVDFYSSEQDFHFTYPSNFKLDQKTFPGSEILYHVDFQNKSDKKFIGFVQVWNLPYPLEKFLESSKENSLSEFINFSSKKITVNDLDGFFWEYTVKSAKENFKCLEVFLSKGTKMYRLSFYIPEKKYSKEDYDMFWKMVNSFKIG